MNWDKVVLVNEQDVVIGEMDKLEAHQQGLLHRAFSIFIFNSKGEMLLQQRGKEKYHGAGLWTNACCSHPQLAHEVSQSAASRLQFEMGLQCQLSKAFCFTYRTPVENSLIEHEFDYVFIGHTDAQPQINPNEVADYNWIKVADLLASVQAHPFQYTEWFKMALPTVLEYLDRGRI